MSPARLQYWSVRLYLACIFLLGVSMSSAKAFTSKLSTTPPTGLQAGRYINVKQVPALEAMAKVWNFSSRPDLGWAKPWRCQKVKGIICDASGNVAALVMPGSGGPNSCFLPGIPGPLTPNGNPTWCPWPLLLPAPIPQNINLLDTLTWMDLSSHVINGTIPDGLFDIVSLGYLNLAYNQFEAGVPPGISRLTNLQGLLLGGTQQLSQPLPTGIAALKKLSLLNLEFGGFRGEIPSAYGNLTNLLNLIANENSLSGSIPESFSSLSSLVNLDLNNNNMTGSIPEFLGTLTNLTYLSLSHNDFSGTLSSSLGDLKDLAFLDLSYNRNITGVLPPSLAQLTHITPAAPPLFTSSILLTNTSTTCPVQTSANCLGPPPVNTTSQFCLLVCKKFCTACGNRAYTTASSPGTNAGNQSVSDVPTASPFPPFAFSPPPPPVAPAPSSGLDTSVNATGSKHASALSQGLLNFLGGLVALGVLMP